MFKRYLGIILIVVMTMSLSETVTNKAGNSSVKSQFSANPISVLSSSKDKSVGKTVEQLTATGKTEIVLTSIGKKVTSTTSTKSPTTTTSTTPTSTTSSAATTTSTASSTATTTSTAPSTAIPAGYISINDFGASTSVQNNAAAINKAVATSSNIAVPAGSYKIQSTVRLKNGLVLQGIKGSSKIIIDDTFKKGQYLPENEFAIINSDFSQAYNNLTADDITIRGITFVMTKNSTDSITTILGLANVKHLVIEDCEFICQGSPFYSNNLDIYAADKNVTINNCSFKNVTAAYAGAIIQVRDLTSDGSNVNNETANVVIQNCTLEKNSNDEAIAIYSVIGQVRNVQIRNNTIKLSGTKTEVVTAIYAGEFNKYATAKIKDVVYENNNLQIQNFGSAIVQVGQSSDQISTIDNVTIRNNTINANIGATGVSAVIKVNELKTITNVNVSGNKISNSGTIPIYYAIIGGNTVSSNTITGKYNDAITDAKTADHNIIDNINGAAFENCINVTNNTILNCIVGVKCYWSTTFTIASNLITVANKQYANGIQGLNINGAVPIINSSNNNIVLAGSSASAYYNNAGVINKVGDVVKAN